MSTWAPWLADDLRGSGLTVVEHSGWKTRGHGGFTDLRGAVWHHDASARGDSPGVPAYMLRNWNTAAAQLWVERHGIWHVLAAGVAWHAGRVLPGKLDNWTSLGIETDHTTGEDWPADQLASLRFGTAVILDRLRKPPASGLAFHKTICSPRGRKTDPDGLDLGTERRNVGALMARKPLVLNHTQGSEDHMTNDQLAQVLGAIGSLTAEEQASRNEVGRPTAEHPSTVQDRLIRLERALKTGGEQL